MEWIQSAGMERGCGDIQILHVLSSCDAAPLFEPCPATEAIRLPCGWEAPISAVTAYEDLGLEIDPSYNSRTGTYNQDEIERRPSAC